MSDWNKYIQQSFSSRLRDSTCILSFQAVEWRDTRCLYLRKVLLIQCRKSEYSARVKDKRVGSNSHLPCFQNGFWESLVFNKLIPEVFHQFLPHRPKNLRTILRWRQFSFWDLCSPLPSTPEENDAIVCSPRDSEGRRRLEDGIGGVCSQLQCKSEKCHDNRSATDQILKRKFRKL